MWAIGLQNYMHVVLLALSPDSSKFVSLIRDPKASGAIGGSWRISPCVNCLLQVKVSVLWRRKLHRSADPIHKPPQAEQQPGSTMFAGWSNHAIQLH